MIFRGVPGKLDDMSFDIFKLKPSYVEAEFGWKFLKESKFL